MSASLCDAVAQRSDSQSVLAHLERANLFLVSMDDVRYWYRYHRLFADLLRFRLEQTRTEEEVRDLRLRAMSWHEQHGMIEEAITHALQARDWASVVRLLSPIALSMLKQNRFAALNQWLKALPRAALQARPDLCIWHAWTMMMSGSVDELEEVLGMAERAEKGCDDPSRSSAIQSVRAVAAYFRGDMGESVDRARLALERVGPNDPVQRGIALHALGIGLAHSGRPVEAQPFLTEVCQISTALNSPSTLCMSLAEIGYCWMERGRLRQALETLEQTERVTGARLAQPIVSTPLYLANLYLEWNDLERADRYSREAQEMNRSPGRWLFSAKALVTRAHVAWAMGDPRSALRMLRSTAGSSWGPDPAALRLSLRILTSLQQMTDPERWADEQGALYDAPVTFDVEDDLFLWARIRIAGARLTGGSMGAEKAIPLLQRLATAMQRADRIGRLIEALALEALARDAAGDAAGALERLDQALAQAEPDRFTRIFLDEGRPMADLVAHSAVRADSPNRAGALLTAFPLQTNPAASPGPVPLLTDREQEVLKHLASGQTNQEIARSLFVSANTVKTHILHLYEKLGVSNRTAAVAKARDTSLI